MKKPRLMCNPADIGVPNTVAVEPYGIRLGYPDRAARRLEFATATYWLEQGILDSRPDTGLRLAMALIIATKDGLFTQPEGDTRAIWRWVAVAVFLTELVQSGQAVWVYSREGCLVPAVVYSAGSKNAILTPEVLRMNVAEVVESNVCQRFPGGGDHRQYAVQSYKLLLEIIPGTDDLGLSVSGRNRFVLFQEWAVFTEAVDRYISLYDLKH